MRFHNILLIMCLLALFTSVGNSTVQTYLNLISENRELLEKKDSTRFISESFINTCEGNGFESLYEWQRRCKAMFCLDYLGWGKAESFIDDSKINTENLMYGKWKSSLGEGEIYFRGVDEK